jgi:hypothetical protein
MRLSCSSKCYPEGPVPFEPEMQSCMITAILIQGIRIPTIKNVLNICDEHALKQRTTIQRRAFHQLIYKEQNGTRNVISFIFYVQHFLELL